MWKRPNEVKSHARDIAVLRRYSKLCGNDLEFRCYNFDCCDCIVKKTDLNHFVRGVIHQSVSTGSISVIGSVFAFYHE